MRPPEYRLDQTRKVTKREKLEQLMRQLKSPTKERLKIDPKTAKPLTDDSWSRKDWLAFWASIILPIVGWFHEEIIEAIKQLIL